MNKKSKRKKTSKRIVPTWKKDVGQSYIRFDPFEGIPRDELLKGLKELGEQCTANIQAEFESLNANILKSNPLSLLSVLAHYGMSQYIDDEGNSTKRENWISQHHVELLQAIVLSHDYDEYNHEPMLPPVMQEIWNGLLKVSESFHTARLRDIGGDYNEEVKRKRAVQEWLRIHTQCVRNWGYLEKVLEIMCCLIQPLEEEIRTKLGVSITLLFDFAIKSIGDIEKRSTNNFLKLKRVFKSKNIEQLVQAYYREFPDMKGDESELISLISTRQGDLQQAKAMLVSHNELSFFDFFVFDIDEFQNFLLPGYSSHDLLTSLDAISLSFGSIKSTNKEHVFLDNPCWKKPVIKLNQTTYFWPLPMLLFSFCHDIIENIISSDKALLNKYFDRRADFLEDRVASIFKSQFTLCEIFCGSLWRDPSSGREYESDLLVLIDCFAIVVEAKSGRVTDPAKRGALPRLERTINDLVESASIQSERFAEMIGSTKNIVEFSTRKGSVNVVDLSRVTNVARLTVLLDDIATIQSRVRELKEAGIINASTSIAPTMLISDLETVIDILETPAIFLHYLLRRNEIQVNSVMIGDELDILAFYIDTGFNIGTSEYDNDTHIYLTGMSSKIDKYNEFKGQLTNVRKPSPRITKWWRDIITQLEKRNTYRWLEIAIKLLNVAYDDQQKVEKKFASIKKQVKANWFRNGHLNSVMFCSGPAERRDAFVFLAYRDRHSDKRREWASNASASIMEEHHLTEALALGVNIDIGHYPYSFIAMCAPQLPDRQPTE